VRPEEPAQAIVDDLADRLGASILAEDPAERVIAYSAQQGPIDQVRQDCILARAASPAVVEFFSHYGLAEAEGPLRTPSEPQLGLLGRLCVPVRSHRRLLGYLWIIDDAGSLGADAERSALDAARRLALVLEEQERLASLRSDLVGQLLSESPELVAHAAGVVLERRLLPAPGGCVACVLRAGAGLEPARAAGVLTEIAAELATPLVAADEHSAVAIVPAGRDRPGRDVVAPAGTWSLRPPTRCAVPGAGRTPATTECSRSLPASATRRRTPPGPGTPTARPASPPEPQRRSPRSAASPAGTASGRTGCSSSCRARRPSPAPSTRASRRSSPPATPS